MIERNNLLERKPITEAARKVIETASSIETRRGKMEYLALSFYENKFSNIETMCQFLEEELNLRTSIINIYRNKYPKLTETELEEATIERVDQLLGIYRNEGLVAFIRERDKGEASKLPMAGIFYYTVNKNKEGLLAYSIHFDKEKVGSDAKGAFSIEESFQILVDKIVEDKTLPAFIEARSWLMGVEALRTRMGFEIKHESEFEERGRDGHLDLSPSTWGQFLDLNGEIKEAEVAYLYANGHPRYKKVRASLSIDELFRKHGTKYHGQKLTFIDSSVALAETKRISSFNKVTMESLRLNFEGLSYEEIIDIFSQIDPLKTALGTPIGEKFKDALREAKDSNLSFKDLDLKYKEIIDEFNTAYEEMTEKYVASLKKEFVYEP